MNIALTAMVVVPTVGVGVLVLAGLIRACLNLRRGLTVPPRMWVALLTLAVFVAGGVWMLMTQGRGHRLLPLFSMAVATLGLVYQWLARREARSVADSQDAEQEPKLTRDRS